jgi:ribosomal protein L11 methyltransferase
MKPAKPLWRISVTTSFEAEDAVTELLSSHFNQATAAYFDVELGISTVSVFPETKPVASKIRREIARGLKHIATCGLKIGAGRIKIAKVKREDWAESWKRHFHPMTIGNRLLVKPSWSKQRPLKGQAVVILDPGLSFGTGQHPTTSFCLREIVHAASRTGQPAKKMSFLDIGTGSGILAIAAAKLGFAPVHAFDFDPESVRVARENTQKNRVSAQCKIRRADITKLPPQPRRQYDLVCANLISNLLIAERRKIVSQLKPGGTLVLAGILAAEFDDVRVEFEKSRLKLAEKRVENEWCSGSFCFV